MNVKRNDIVKGWFGTGIVTDVGYGQITTLGGLIDGPEDDMVRLIFSDRSTTYVYKSDIKEVL